LLSLRPRTSQARVYPFLNPRALELCDRAKDAGHEPTGCCAGIDAFAESYERDAARLPLVEEQHEVPEVPAEPIESPADDRVDFVSTDVSHQAIERGPAVLGPAHALIDVLDRRPATRLNVAA
jgi:hypothetical protein